jgi:hypothetical protein
LNYSWLTLGIKIIPGLTGLGLIPLRIINPIDWSDPIISCLKSTDSSLGLGLISRGFKAIKLLGNPLADLMPEPVGNAAFWQSGSQSPPRIDLIFFISPPDFAKALGVLGGVFL